MPSKYRPKRPMRVESLGTPSPEFLSPMLWKRENPSHLQPNRLRVGRSFVCRVVLADHLAARVCARRRLELVIASSPARGGDGTTRAIMATGWQRQPLPAKRRNFPLRRGGTSCHQPQPCKAHCAILRPLSAKVAERTLDRMTKRSGLQVTRTIRGQTCRSGDLTRCCKFRDRCIPAFQC
jgi:hypothetical protein